MKESPIWYQLLRGLTFIVFKLLFRIRIEGKTNIPLQGGVILASNHRSYLDPIVLGLLTQRKINFLAKEELFRNPVFGYFISKLGAFPIKRQHLKKKSYLRAVQLLEDGKILALFPEGTRMNSPQLGFFHKGALKISYETKVPVVPVFIKGTDRALPPHKEMIRLARIEARAGVPLNKHLQETRLNKRQEINNLSKALENKLRELGKLSS